MKAILFSLAISVMFANGIFAEDGCGPAPCCGTTHDCCNRCGVQKRCKVVCETKTVKTSCWVVECEEFCPSLPNRGCCQSACGDCGDDACCDDHCASLVKPMVRPKCGKLRSRKILTKKTITCEVPVYRCVVVCCNSECDEGGCGGEEAAPQAAPAQQSTTNTFAPPPVLLGTSYLKTLKAGR